MAGLRLFSLSHQCRAHAWQIVFQNVCWINEWMIITANIYLELTMWQALCQTLLHAWCILNLITTLRSSCFFFSILILQMRRVRHREVKWLAHSHTARKLWNQAWNPSLSNSKASVFNYQTKCVVRTKENINLNLCWGANPVHSHIKILLPTLPLFRK